MRGNSSQKLKLLYLIDILTEYTDDDHPLSADEMCGKLAEFGIPAQRKAIYRDLSTLSEYGFDIVKTRIPKSGFALGQRRLEMPEIRLIIDAVQAASFITPKKTRELVAKLEKFLSRHQAQALSRQVYMDYRAKQLNEEIYYSIDVIATAISQQKKISLTYYRRQISENITARSYARDFTVSPYAMLWSSDHYYLVCNNAKYDNLMHLRIDRMKSVHILDEPMRPFYEVSEYTDSFDVADYSSKIFNMFGGSEVQLKLRCKNGLIENVIDRFGQDIPLRASGDDHFVITTPALVSDGLVAWILQFGADMELIEPRELRERLSQKAKELFEIYKPELRPPKEF